ncbi:hypothetical protein BBD41_08665 [Paenibacillus ihbetae]|uniref:Uncharacterized protein n=1 Tax=Paenibacillus ihbetae TaxID=1870820 RepID=A0A1B2DYA1_9BACL|nr:hypothetical protein BBD41_08665 [Paenibacillus ihbetae]OOC58555.1 hypothetical protein BBD40_22910 [Paenibacillus ihbetae]
MAPMRIEASGPFCIHNKKITFWIKRMLDGHVGENEVDSLYLKAFGGVSTFFNIHNELIINN